MQLTNFFFLVTAAIGATAAPAGDLQTRASGVKLSKIGSSWRVGWTGATTSQQFTCSNNGLLNLLNFNCVNVLSGNTVTIPISILGAGGLAGLLPALGLPAVAQSSLLPSLPALSSVIATLLPTSLPVSVPTSLPVSVPTSLPISVPTSLPISVPTSLPVSLPTGTVSNLVPSLVSDITSILPVVPTLISDVTSALPVVPTVIEVVTSAAPILGGVVSIVTSAVPILPTGSSNDAAPTGCPVCPVCPTTGGIIPGIL